MQHIENLGRKFVNSIADAIGLQRQPIPTEPVAATEQEVTPEQLANEAAAMLQTDISESAASWIIYPTLPAAQAIESSDIHGAAEDSAYGVDVFCTAGELARRGDQIGNRGNVKSLSALVKSVYADQIDLTANHILYLMQKSSQVRKENYYVKPLVVQSSDQALGQLVVQHALRRVAHEISKAGAGITPVDIASNPYDLNGGEALIIGWDNTSRQRYGSMIPGQGNSFQRAIDGITDIDTPHHGSSTAPALIYVTDVQSRGSEVPFEVVRQFQYASRNNFHSVDLPGFQPDIIVYVGKVEPKVDNEKPVNDYIVVEVPPLSREHWEAAYIPEWMREVGLDETIAEIVGPTLDRVDTMILVGTLTLLQRDWDSRDSRKADFKFLFKDGAIPVLFLQEATRNIIKMHTHMNYTHLGDAINYADAMQKVLLAVQAMDDNGVIPADRWNGYLAQLNTDPVLAKRYIKDSINELGVLARDKDGQIEILSPTLLNLLRRMAKKSIILMKSAIHIPFDSQLICGYCGNGVVRGTRCCVGCNGPAENYVVQEIKRS